MVKIIKHMNLFQMFYRTSKSIRKMDFQSYLKSHWCVKRVRHLLCGIRWRQVILVAHRAVLPEIDEIEKAVLTLPDVLRETVKEFYLNDYSTPEQKMKYLGVSKKTLYRRIDKAHGEIQVSLIVI